MTSPAPQRQITSLSRSGPSLARRPPPALRKPQADGDKREQAGDNADQQEETISFSLYKFMPIYIKVWDGPQTDCQICHSSLIQPCYICVSENKEDPCPQESGACGHSFHKHCISRWTANNNTCPICSKAWNPKK